MTQHDKIWILNKSQEFALRDKNGYSPGCIEGPVICATIEELREIWEVANQRGYNIGSEGHSGNTTPKDLDEYLTSKGIKIP